MPMSLLGMFPTNVVKNPLGFFVKFSLESVRECSPKDYCN